MTTVQFYSPIKDNNNASESRNFSSTVSRQFDFSECCNESKLTLSQKYEYNLEHPTPNAADAPYHSDIRNIILSIEDHLHSTLLIDGYEEIISIIKQKVLVENPIEKLVELGMILFYLDRDGNLPESESLIYFRAMEMDNEIKDCIAKHRKTKADPRIPSGKTHYISRAFAHMVITSQQVYNMGGVMAIKELLENPSMKIAKYLQPEHHQHILIILDQFIKDPRIKRLLQSPATVHPDLEYLVQIDLKLSIYEPVQSTHILYDCLMALFTDIRQKSAPNCYAIAALIYLTENYAAQFLTKTLDFLEKGHITLNGKHNIPIEPLIESRLCIVKDLDSELKTSSTHKLAPIDQISRALNLDFSSASDRYTRVTIEEVLLSNEKKQQTYIHKLFSAYKYNSLILLNITLSEYIYINASSFYSKFITRCKKTIHTTLDKFDRVPTCYLEEFERRLTDVIWIENRNEQKIVVDGTSLQTQIETVSNFRGNIMQLKSLLEKSLRICYWENNTYRVIKTNKELTELLVLIATRTMTSFKSADTNSNKRKYNLKRIENAVVKAVHKKKFIKKVAKFSAKQIESDGITHRNLIKSNLLIFQQIGGSLNKVLQPLYDIELSRNCLPSCDNPLQLLESLSESIPVLCAQEFNHCRKLLIRTKNEHAWTVDPDNWLLLIENQSNFSEFIQYVVNDKADDWLDEPITEELMHAVVNKYTRRKQLRISMKEKFNHSSNLTKRDFLQQFLESLRQSKVEKGRKVIDEVYSKVTVNTDSLSAILNQLNVNVNDDCIQSIYDALPIKPIQPYILSRLIRHELIEQESKILSPYAIELAICRVLNRAISIYIGDSNWIDRDTEDPFHLELAIRFHYGTQSLEIMIRYRKHEKLEKREEYQNLNIFYPPTPLDQERGW